MLPVLALVVIGVLYGAYFVPGFWAGLSWWVILAVAAVLALACLIGSARSVGYRPISAPPTASLWHIVGVLAVAVAAVAFALGRSEFRQPPWMGRVTRAAWCSASGCSSWRGSCTRPWC
ncbi:hypothetical protein GCM10027215_34520 [Nocardioides zeae]